MSEIPEDLRYTKSHEWVRLDDDGTLTVGITDHAQEQLGDMVYVEVPEVGRHVDEDEACAVVESVKAASDVYAPVAGEIVTANDALADSPELINQDCYGDGWIFGIKPDDAGAYERLMDAAAYRSYLESEG